MRELKRPVVSLAPPADGRTLPRVRELKLTLTRTLLGVGISRTLPRVRELKRS